MKPILFNTEMVQAIMDGRKTVTRRAVKAPVLTKSRQPDKVSICGGMAKFIWSGPDTIGDFEIRLPHRIDDVLYVRETWQKNPYGSGWPYFYKAYPEQFDPVPEKWRPSIHMPREAARIFLRVKSVRVERLQNIDDDGVAAEGFEIGAPFDDLWDGTIKKSDIPIYGWNANPWVWVTEFERISREEAVE